MPLLFLVEYILIEHLSHKFASYRNNIAHFLSNSFRPIEDARLYQGFKVLELTVQICILDLLGFTYPDIIEIYMLNRMDSNSKINSLIKSRIDLF
jgi:hypothetical protein